MTRRTTRHFPIALLTVTLGLELAVRPASAASSPHAEAAVDSANEGDDRAEVIQVRWNTQMDPAGPITLLAGRAVAAASAGPTGTPCPGGGKVATLCREDGAGTFMSTTVTACRLIDEEGRVLSISGDLLLSAPIAGGCQTVILPQCTHVSVRAVNYVATITDADGMVLDTISVHDRTTDFREILLPCDVRAAR